MKPATTDRAPRRRPMAGARTGWLAAALGVAAAVVAPVAAVAWGGATAGRELWIHLWDTRLPEMLVTTVVLLVLVGLGTLALGAGLAWLVSAYDFPGKSVFVWLLILPLAMPAYILGFVFLSLLDFAGPVQTALRALLGPGAWFPEVRSIGGAALVLTLTLYPYVYLLARASLAEQARATFEVARTLGSSRLEAARRVVLPLARPSLAAGLTLVMMETLTDFASVQYFNVQTISVGVFRVWKGMGDRLAAVQLSLGVLGFALAVVVLERFLRSGARYHQADARGRFPSVALSGWRGWGAAGVCGAVLSFAFVVPMLRLLAWSGHGTGPAAGASFDWRFVEFLGNSTLLAGLTGVVSLLLAFVLANAARLHGGPLSALASRLSLMGYGVPGPVVAIGVLVVIAGGLGALGVPGAALLVTGSLVGVTYAYVVRFLAVAFGGVEASMEKVTPSMTESGLLLGASAFHVIRRVHLPLMRAGAVAGLTLVLIDALKELPIVLLLRPFGFTTVSVWVWQLASESRWQGAALPALVVVLAAAVPVVLLGREDRHHLPSGVGSS